MFLSALLFVSPILAPAFAAPDDEEEYDEESPDAGKKKKGPAGKGQIREIVRGFYARSAVGGASYLTAPRDPVIGAQYLSAGTYVGLSLGQDFVDQEKMSMAWELTLAQGVHNGLSPELRDGTVGLAAWDAMEGDLRTYSVIATYEYSYYPVRRFGIGGHVGGGVAISPLLVDETAYVEDIIPDESYARATHNTPLFIAQGGLTVEYYTKLNHLSVGADVDGFYNVIWGVVGLQGAGYLKYTF